MFDYSKNTNAGNLELLKIMIIPITYKFFNRPEISFIRYNTETSWERIHEK